MTSPLPNRRPIRPPVPGLPDPGRPAIVARIRKILERRETPRIEMAIMALLTGAAGFLGSWGLLQLGVRSMPWRYVFAMLFAYGVFFPLLRYWLHLHGRRLEVDDDGDLTDLLEDLPSVADPGFTGGGGEFGGGGASASFADGAPVTSAPAPDVVPAGSGIDVGDSVDIGDADVATIPLLVGAAVLLAVLSSFWVVWGAPTLLAELLVDCALVGGLYRRLRRQEERDWTMTALRRTFLPFVATTCTLAVAGWWLQRAAPAARTLSEALRIIQER